MENQNINGVSNLPNAQNVNGMGSVPLVQPQMSPAQLQTPPVQPQKTPMKKFIIIGIVVAVVVIVAVILVIMLVSSGKKNEATAYLPQKDSKYDVICEKTSEYAKGMTLSETVGLEEVDEYGYINYSFVNVISKDDGSAIEENENNLEVNKEIKENLERSGYLGVTTSFQDGKIVIEFGISNYSYAKAKDAIKDFEVNGYSCK